MDKAIRNYLTNLNSSQQKEEDFFASDKSMCSVQELHKQVLWKCRSIWLLEEILTTYDIQFSGNVLELAGGYGVHANYIKSRFGDAVRLHYSDSSRTAVEHSQRFEEFFDVSLDEKWICEAETIPAQDNTFDHIYFFASFHHIQDPEKSISECYRTLKPGGKLYLLLEPSSPRFLKKAYNQHSKRDGIEEKNYTRAEYNNFLKTKFSTIERHNFTRNYNRESRRALRYYALISKLPNWLVNFLPCSQVIIATKTSS